MVAFRPKGRVALDGGAELIFDCGGRKMQPATGPKPREGRACRGRNRSRDQNVKM